MTEHPIVVITDGPLDEILNAYLSPAGGGTREDVIKTLKKMPPYVRETFYVRCDGTIMTAREYLEKYDR